MVVVTGATLLCEDVVGFDVVGGKVVLVTGRVTSLRCKTVVETKVAVTVGIAVETGLCVISVLGADKRLAASRQSTGNLFEHEPSRPVYMHIADRSVLVQKRP